MTMPNAFQLGAAGGGNVGRAVQGAAEQTGINRILQEAQASGDPAVMQNAMNQILMSVSPERKPAAIEMAKNYQKQIQNQQAQALLSRSAQQQGMQPDAQQQAQSGQTYSPQELAAAYDNPQLLQTMKAVNEQSYKEQKLDFEKEKAQQQKNLAYEKMNAPQLKELEEKIENTDQSRRDFARLNEIFTKDEQNDPEFAFPTRLTAAMLDLEGGGDKILTRLGKSKLSTGAQEFTKIIVNQLRAAKNTFGARVTNFDAQKFLEGFPGFMNSEAGRRQLLNQIAYVNKINDLVNKGTVEAFEHAGGSGAISMFEAKRRAKALYKPQIDQLEEMAKKGTPFFRPSSEQFTVGGKVYNIPSDQVEEFKKDMGIQ